MVRHFTGHLTINVSFIVKKTTKRHSNYKLTIDKVPSTSKKQY